MSNNIVEYIIKVREQAAEQVKKVSSAMKTANVEAKKTVASADKLVMSINGIKSEIISEKLAKGMTRSDTELRKINKSLSFLHKELGRLETLPPNGFFSRLRKGAEAISGMRIGDLGLAFAATKIKAFVSDSVKAFDIQAKAEAQVRTSLESTGYAAGRTFKQLAEQASNLQSKTIFGDEAILKAQSVLLTFKKIRGEIFDKATPAILDLATKMGGDLQGATVQVGKALNDPIEGITALRRVGITFTDEQEASIKKLVEAGKLQEAQLLVLSELQSQFGGSAEEAARAGMGSIQQLSNIWGDFKEKIGSTALAASNHVVPSLKKTIEFVMAHGTAFKNTAKIVTAATVAYLSFKLAQQATIKTSALLRTIISAKQMAIAAYSFVVKGATRAQIAFNTATKANVIGLAVAGIMAAVTAFKMFKKNAKDTSDQIKNAKNVAADYYAQERSQLDILFEKLKRTNPKSKERNQLVDELKTMYPGLNSQLETELRNTNNLSNAYSVLINKISTRARIKAKESLLEDIYKGTEDTDSQISEIVDTLTSGSASFRPSVGGKTYEKTDRAGIYNALVAQLKKSRGVYGGVVIKGFQAYMAAQEKAEGILKQIGDITFASGDSTTDTTTTETRNDINSIAVGGKSVKNFNITINDGLIKQVDNHFTSTGESPESAQDFMWRLSEALQRVLNDVNYAAA
jgi:hypothetical protein